MAGVFLHKVKFVISFLGQVSQVSTFTIMTVWCDVEYLNYF